MMVRQRIAKPKPNASENEIVAAMIIIGDLWETSSLVPRPPPAFFEFMKKSG